MRGKELLERAGAALSLCLLLAVWEAVCRLGWTSPLLLSRPSRILPVLIDLLASRQLSADIASTLTSFGLSLALAVLLGATLGVAMGLSSSWYHLFHPYMISLNSVPKIALMPMVALWFGLGQPPKVFLGTLMGCFPIAMASYAAVRNLERDTLLVARSFGAGNAMILRTIVLPGLLPHVLSSLRVAVNYALVGVLTVEFFAADRGIGYKMVLYSSNFQTDAFFALLLFVVGLALLCAGTLHLLENRLIHWRGETWK